MGNQWNIARVTVTPGTGRQVIFEAVTGSGWAGDIALDDIKQIPGNCPPPGRQSLIITSEQIIFCFLLNKNTNPDRQY